MELQEPLKRVQSVDVGREAGEPLPAAPPQNLVNLSHELAYFTPALLYTHGRFSFDPIEHFNQMYPGDPKPFSIDCQHPFFQQLPLVSMNNSIVDWNHRLLAIRRERWDELREAVARSVISITAEQYFCEQLYADIQIVDPVSMLQQPASSTLPIITVTVFCPSSNRQFVYLQPAKQPPVTRAYPKVKPPRADTLSRAAVHFGPPPDPLSIVRDRRTA